MIRFAISNNAARVVCWSGLIVAVSNSVVHAQFKLDIEKVAAAAFPQPDDTLPPDDGEVQEQLVMGQFDLQRNIDAWVFNPHGNEANVRTHLSNQLKIAIDAIDRVCVLSDAQKAKFQLAGQGDVTLFFAELETVREAYRGHVDQNQINRVWQDVQPLQRKLQNNIFGQESVFERVVAGTLAGDQVEEFQADQQSRIDFMYVAAIKLSVANIEKSVPLLSSQRQQLVELLSKSERPKTLGRYANYYVLYRLAKIKKELEDVLDKTTLDAMQSVFAQGQGLEQFLKQNGYID